MFTAESSPHLSLSSLFPLPYAVCDQSRPLASSASLMGLQSCPATWPAMRSWSSGGCWMAPTWKPRGLASRMLGRRFNWTKLSLGSLCVKFWRGTVSQGPGPLLCLAAMVSNSISRKSFFWSLAAANWGVVGVLKISNSSVLWHLPSRWQLFQSYQILPLESDPLISFSLLCLGLTEPTTADEISLLRRSFYPALQQGWISICLFSYFLVMEICTLLCTDTLCCFRNTGCFLLWCASMTQMPSSFCTSP